MDPISAFGLVSGAFQIGQIVTETLAGLARLRERYQHADLTIGALERQLAIIKAAVAQLEDWAKARLRDSPAECNRSLDVALDGCRTVMDALSNEVLLLMQGASPNETTIGFRTRMRVVWREDVMRGHQERLQSQVFALQLLVQACQCQSSAEQIELLRKAENRHIIWKAADDAETLRSSTRLSQLGSSTGNTVFDFDGTLARTVPYLRIPQRQISRPTTRSTTSNGNQSQTIDEGYASGINTSASVSRTGSLVLPHHPSGNINPTIGHSNSVALSPAARTPSSNPTRRSKSDSGSRREKIQSVSSPQSSTRVLTNGSGHGRRCPHDKDIKTSIDLSSPDGSIIPLILIERGCDLEAKHLQSRRTALLVAAHCGNEEVVDLLICKNARLDAVDKSGSTALHLAASRAINLEARDSRGREVEATQLLLLAKAKVNPRADAQMTALHIAAKQGDDAIVKLLVKSGADLEVKDSHLAVIDILLDNKVDVDLPGCDKRTPLICAAAVGELPATQLLLNKKASSRCSDDFGMTALHWAAYNGHTEVVELLSSKKGSLAVVNVAKRTALHLAIMNSHFAVSGMTALHYACLANSADIEAQVEDGSQRRPVHLAAIQGSMGLLNLLCDKGALLDARDSVGYRALGVACRVGHAAAVQNLLDRGSPVHLQPDIRARDNSLLCLAAMGGHLPVITLLLERAYHGHSRILETLLSRTLISADIEGLGSKLQLVDIGFAPEADISEERKSEVLDLLHRAKTQPESLTQDLASSRVSRYRPEMHQSSQDSYTTRVGFVPIHQASSSLARRAETTKQGLPISRSQTPEQMHRPNEEQTNTTSTSGISLGRNSAIDFGESRHASPPSRHQQLPVPGRPPLNHPSPVREPLFQPDGLLRIADLFGGHYIDTPLSVAQRSTTQAEDTPPFQNQTLEIWISNRGQQSIDFDTESDSDSDSFSTASEGGTSPARDIAELLA
ncbi:ankyrin repeat-containing domain protein [Aspergillus filifer]